MMNNIFLQILKEAGSIVAIEKMPLSGVNSSLKFLFDMDKVWNSGSTFTKMATELNNLFERSLKGRGISLIVVRTSMIGSYGPIPLASSLAIKQGLDLVILNQVSFDEYNAYPSSSDTRELFEGKKVLLLQDVILHGYSIARVGEFLSKQKAFLDTVLVIVDYEPLNIDRSDIEKLQQTTNWIKLVGRKDIEELSK